MEKHGSGWEGNRSDIKKFPFSQLWNERREKQWISATPYYLNFLTSVHAGFTMFLPAYRFVNFPYLCSILRLSS